MYAHTSPARMASPGGLAISVRRRIPWEDEEMKCFSRYFATAMTMLIGTLVVHDSTYAQIGPDPATTPRHSRIVGLWNVDVVVARCDNGDVISTFSALHKYDLGGTGQVVPSGSPTALSAHMMIWNYVKRDHYQMALKFYRFDSEGAYVGWNVIRNEVSISRDGTEYVGSGVAEIYGADGSFLGASCPSFVGTRFTGE
jgi:hypothetical protein